MRTVSVGALALAGALLLGLPGPGRAAEEPIIRTGAFGGRWHDQKVEYRIAKVGKHGRFSGEMEFLEDPVKGIRSNFTGKISKHGYVSIIRFVNYRDTDETQMAVAGPPTLERGVFIWEGDTAGAGVPKALRFQLRVPRK
jgi:hypothetical protein